MSYNTAITLAGLGCFILILAYSAHQLWDLYNFSRGKPNSFWDELLANCHHEPKCKTWPDCRDLTHANIEAGFENLEKERNEALAAVKSLQEENKRLKGLLHAEFLADWSYCETCELGFMSPLNKCPRCALTAAEILIDQKEDQLQQAEQIIRRYRERMHGG